MLVPSRPPPAPRPAAPRPPLAAAAALAAATLAARAALAAPVDPATVLIDAARLVPDGQEAALVARLRGIEERGGPRVRVATLLDGDPASPSQDDLRAAWRPNARTVVLLADPGAPNMLRVFAGLNTNVSRAFSAELVGRYGNLFARREAGGEVAAFAAAVDVLLTCVDPDVHPDGCAVVPGVDRDQAALTLVFAAAGGFVAGFASRLASPPFESTPWVWVLLFAPLWGTLLFSFGLGPLVVRGAAPADLATNVAAFAAAAFLFRLSPLFAPGAYGADRGVLTREGRKRVEESEDEEG